MSCPRGLHLTVPVTWFNPLAEMTWGEGSALKINRWG